VNSSSEERHEVEKCKIHVWLAAATLWYFDQVGLAGATEHLIWRRGVVCTVITENAFPLFSVASSSFVFVRVNVRDAEFAFANNEFFFHRGL